MAIIRVVQETDGSLTCSDETEIRNRDIKKSYVPTTIYSLSHKWQGINEIFSQRHAGGYLCWIWKCQLSFFTVPKDFLYNI